jgi:hypothetical protein
MASESGQVYTRNRLYFRAFGANLSVGGFKLTRYLLPTEGVYFLQGDGATMRIE